MEVMVIENNTFKHLMQRIENVEQMTLALIKIAKQDKEIGVNITPEFISRKQAMREFQISHVTVDYKAKKYGVTRQKAGRKLLLNRAELIKALNEKEPIPAIFNK